MARSCSQLTTVGVYLLDCLDQVECAAFVHHLADCRQCRAEVVELTPAVHALVALRRHLGAGGSSTGAESPEVGDLPR